MSGWTVSGPRHRWSRPRIGRVQRCLHVGCDVRRRLVPGRRYTYRYSSPTVLGRGWAWERICCIEPSIRADDERRALLEKTSRNRYA